MSPFLRSAAARIQFLTGATAIVLVLFWPLTPALSPADQRLARSVCLVLAAVASGVIALVGRGVRSFAWTIVATVSGLMALAALYLHFDAGNHCIADYNGEPTIIGRELTPVGEQVVAKGPRQSDSELLFSAGGEVEAVWTERSLARCRFWVSWGGLLAIPLFGVCVGSLAARRGAHLWSAGSHGAATAAVSKADPRPTRYDAFISYRRLDRERAEALADAIESRGFSVAIDFRDFRPNETVLAEMERCIGESRFVFCVITQNYVSSGFTNEEALMAKLLDLTERRNRIVPLIFEHAPMPAWLQGLVGVEFTAGAQIDPIDRLMTLLSQEQGH